MDAPKTLQQAIQLLYRLRELPQVHGVELRWPDGVVRCPRCHSDNVTYLQESARLQVHRSKHPKQKFSLKVGTVFEDSPIPLEKWLPALWLMVSCKNGVSSYEIHRALGVTQKSAWFMLHRIRVAMKTGGFGMTYKLGGSDGGAVEVDETFIGGKVENMHKSRRLKLNQIRDSVERKDHYMGKTVVMGMLDRELRQVRAKVVPNIKREALQERNPQERQARLKGLY